MNHAKVMNEHIKSVEVVEFTAPVTKVASAVKSS